MNPLERVEAKAPSVLVVTSDPSALAPIVDALRLDGFSVTVAEDGYQGCRRRSGGNSGWCNLRLVQ
jgi:DNA-binding response OmpR family regulator